MNLLPELFLNINNNNESEDFTEVQNDHSTNINIFREVYLDAAKLQHFDINQHI